MNRKCALLIIITILLTAFSACGRSEVNSGSTSTLPPVSTPVQNENTQSNTAQREEPRILIAYFTRLDNTDQR